MSTRQVTNCPNCHKRMSITKLHCQACDITVEGRFSLDRFALLDEEVVDFIEVFVLSRGVITEIEKRLGISYPTVKTKIDKMVAAVQKMKKLEADLAAEQEAETCQKLEKEAVVKNMMKNQ